MNVDGAVKVVDLEDILKVIFTEDRIAVLKKEIEEAHRQKEMAAKYKLLKSPHEYRVDIPDITISAKELKNAFRTRTTLHNFAKI